MIPAALLTIGRAAGAALASAMRTSGGALRTGANAYRATNYLLGTRPAQRAGQFAQQSVPETGGGYSGQFPGTSRPNVDLHPFARSLIEATGAIGKFTLAAAAFPSKVAALGDTMIAGQAQHAAYNGNFQGALAALEVGRHRRNLAMAAGTSGSFGSLVQSQNRLENQTAPYERGVQTLNNVIQTFGNRLTATIVEGIDKATGSKFPKWMEQLNESMGPGGQRTPMSVQLLQDLSEGKLTGRRLPRI